MEFVRLSNSQHTKSDILPLKNSHTGLHNVCILKLSTNHTTTALPYPAGVHMHYTLCYIASM